MWNSLHGQGLNTNNLRRQLLPFRTCMLLLFHERERKHLLDTIIISQEHHKSVDAHAPAPSGRETEFQTRAEVLIDQLRLVVTLSLLGRLLFESKTLVKGVVQLCVRVDDFLLAHEGFEALTQPDVVAMVFGQRRHHLRMPGDECRVDAGLFDEFSDKLIEHAGVGFWRRAFDIDFLQELLEELVCLHGMQLITGRELLARSFFKGRDHLNSLPWSLPIDLEFLARLGMECSFIATSDMLYEPRNKFLGHVHDIVDISVCPVELARGEFRVMSEIDALVSELTTQLVNSFQATDNQHFEIKLRSDTQEHVHVEVVVVRNKWLRSGTASNSVHHRSLHLDEVALIEKAADIRNHLGPGDEDIPRSVVHNQVQIPLSIALLLIPKPIMFRGDLMQTRREQHHFRSEYRQLSIRAVLRGSAAWKANNAHNVSSSQMFMLVLEGDVSLHVLRLACDLDLHALSTNIVENQFGPCRPLGIDPSRDAQFLVLDLVTLLQRLVLLNDLSYIIRDQELMWVWVGALSLSEFIHSSTSDLEVLVRRQIALFLLSTGLLLWLGGCGSGPLLPFRFLSPMLLSFLQFRLRHVLTGDFIKVQVCEIVGSGIGSWPLVWSPHCVGNQGKRRGIAKCVLSVR
ncbi:hypothetical protein ACKS0A_10728 [Histoplasma ohiense]